MGQGSDRRPLGEILVEDYRVAAADIESALSAQRFSQRRPEPTPNGSAPANHDRIGRLLVRMGVLSERDLVTALGQQLGVPVVIGLPRLTIPDEVLILVPMRMAERKLVIPVEIVQQSLILAMADPTDRSVLGGLEGLVGLHVVPAIAPEEDVRRALKVFYFNEPIHRDPDEITGTFEKLRQKLHEASMPSPPHGTRRHKPIGSVPEAPAAHATTAH